MKHCTDTGVSSHFHTQILILDHFGFRAFKNTRILYYNLGGSATKPQYFH